MILMGLSPHVALAANRTGSMGMELAALIRYLRTDFIYWPWVAIMTPMALVAGLLGAELAAYTQPAVLETVIAVLILLLLPVFWFYKSIGVEARIHHTTTAATIMAFAGFFAILVYGGFLGAGAAPLFLLCLSGLGGMTILQAKATTTIPWFCMGVMAFTVFLLNGFVIWPYCIAALLGMAIGGYFGAHMAIKIGNEYLRYCVIALSMITALLLFVK
jgi:uncharacterized membrane protein YfcA